MPSQSHATSPPRLGSPTPAALRTRLGGLLLALGPAQFFVVHVVVQSAWSQPPYSWWTNYISDLGAVHCGPFLGAPVCSPLHAAMNASFIVHGALTIAGAILIARAWPPTAVENRIHPPAEAERRAHPPAGAKSRTHPARAGGFGWRVMVAVAGCSWIVVGLVPEDVSLTGHSIGALPVFILGNLALLVAGRSRSTHDRRPVRSAALVLGIVGVLGFVLTAVATADPHGPIGVGAAERLTVFPLQIWAFVAGLHISFRPTPPTATRPEQRPTPPTATRPQQRTAPPTGTHPEQR